MIAIKRIHTQKPRQCYICNIVIDQYSYCYKIAVRIEKTLKTKYICQRCKNGITIK